jgi:Tfp pilus assembly protein PilP
LPQLALARDVAAASMSGQRDLFRLSPAAAPLPPQPEPSERTETAAPDPRQIAREQAVAVMEKLRLIGTMSADGRTIALIEHDDRVEQVNVGDEPILGYKVDSITSDVMRISQETLGVTGVFMLTGDEPFRAIWNDK